MMDNLKFLFNNLCETGRSSRAATSRDKVLSSGINNCLLFVFALLLAKPVDPVLSFDSFALARSI
jgi:hypothetical protein